MQANNTPLLEQSPSKKVLQSCLSKSWGGLEMVALENAVALTKNNFSCYTLCLKNSPLEKRLRDLRLPTLTFSERPHLFDFLKIRRFVLDHKISAVLVQLMKDLHTLSLALLNHPEIKIFAISHTFVNIDKKSLSHRWSYAKIDKLICLTSLHKENILEHLPVSEQQIEVLPNYVDCERFSPLRRSESLRREFGAVPGVPLIGIASRLDPQKGQDYALEAMAWLKKKNIPGRLIVVGENTLNETDYLKVLRTQARRLDITDRVQFTGYREDMESIMASLDILLMPSHCETFGRVLIEAMASKTAVIATNAGGVPNIIESGKNGLLVPPHDPVGLARAMESLILDPVLRDRLQESAYFKVRSAYAKDIVESRFLSLLSH
jgi:glycosyltransferase involved in cell wall biosynthesis